MAGQLGLTLSGRGGGCERVTGMSDGRSAALGVCASCCAVAGQPSSSCSVWYRGWTALIAA